MLPTTRVKRVRGQRIVQVSGSSWEEDSFKAKPFALEDRASQIRDKTEASSLQVTYLKQKTEQYLKGG